MQSGEMRMMNIKPIEFEAEDFDHEGKNLGILNKVVKEGRKGDE